MSRRQKGLIVAFFIASLMISLVINLPVKQLFRFASFPAELGIQGLDGTIVKGKLDSVTYQGLSLNDIDYVLQPGCLIKLSVCYKFKSTQNALTLNIATSLISHNISLNQSQIELGPEIINTIPGLLIKPKGRFLLNVDEMTIVDLKLAELSSKIDWMDAGIQGEDQILGNYTAQISREVDRINIELKDKDSLLAANGKILVKLDGQFDLDIKFVSQPTLDKSVASALEMTAKKTGLNRFAIKKTGRVPANIMKILQQIKPEA